MEDELHRKEYGQRKQVEEIVDRGGGQRAVELLAVADKSQSDQCARHRRADVGAHDDWYRIAKVQRPGALLP